MLQWKWYILWFFEDFPQIFSQRQFVRNLRIAKLAQFIKRFHCGASCNQEHRVFIFFLFQTHKGCSQILENLSKSFTDVDIRSHSIWYLIGCIYCTWISGVQLDWYIDRYIWKYRENISYKVINTKMLLKTATHWQIHSGF